MIYVYIVIYISAIHAKVDVLTSQEGGWMNCCFVVVFFLNKILLLSKKSNPYKIKIYKIIIKVKKPLKIS